MMTDAVRDQRKGGQMMGQELIESGTTEEEAEVECFVMQSSLSIGMGRQASPS